MSNPYQAASDIPAGLSYDVPTSVDSRRVEVRPWHLLTKAKDLLGEQYLLFVAIYFVGLLISGAVPFYVLLGPMLCGFHVCLRDRDSGESTKFDRLFKGFDYFGQSLIATLIMMLASSLIIAPVVIGAIAIAGFAAAFGESLPNVTVVATIFGILLFIALTAIVSALIYMPFIFAFALIVDRRMTALDAIRSSWHGGRKNLWGIMGMFLLHALLGTVSVLACYIPLFFFLPLQAGSIFLLYHEIFPDTRENQIPAL